MSVPVSRLARGNSGAPDRDGSGSRGTRAPIDEAALSRLRGDPRRAIRDDGVVCLVYAGNAVRNGLAQMIRRPIVADPALRARGGLRVRMLEELLTRRDRGHRYGRLPSRDPAGRFVRPGEVIASGAS